MPDAEAVNAVAAGSIEAINGVAKASIQAINGVGLPAAGASLWTLVGADGGVGTAAASDLNDWTCYVSASMSTADYNSIAYGKDGSGAALWVAVSSNGNREIRYSSDPTNTSGWSDASTTDNMIGVAWGNNVWIAVGGSGEVRRSTDGASWTEIDMSGVTDWANDVTIYEVVSDGAGKWMFAQGMNVFLSTDDGAGWAPVIDFSDWAGTNLSGYTAYSMAYTAGRWSVFLRATGNSRVYHAVPADTSAWTIGQVGGADATSNAIVHNSARRMAGGDGTVIIVTQNDTSRSTDGGQNWTKNSNDLPRTDARDVATDGLGNWVVVHDSGRVSISTNDGDSWAEQTGDQGSSNTNMRFPTGGSNVENLDAIAADVLLPK
jgi:hypothetical protein